MKTLKLISIIPNWPLILLLILLAGVAEVIGISALVPVASSLTGDFTDSGSAPFPFDNLELLMNLLSIPYSFDYLLIFTMVLILLSFLAIHIQERFIASARYKLCEDLRNKSTNAIFLSKWEHLSGVSSGEVANKVIHESERGAESVIALITFLAGVFQISVYALFCILLSWKLSIIALLTIFLAASSSRYLVNRVKRLGKESADTVTYYSKRMVDFMRGSKLIKATDLTIEVTDDLRSLNNNVSNIATNILINQSKMKFQLQAIVGISMCFILYIAVSILEINVSILLVFLYIIIRLAPKFTGVQGLYFSFAAHRPSLDLVNDLVITAEQNSEDTYSDAKKFSHIRKNILFDSVTYKYPSSEEDVIKDISFEISANQFVAFVGRTGCGKSTILDLIMGLISPQFGKITIDDFDINQFDKNSIRKKIGFVPQDPIFFDGTILQNITFGIESNEKKIWESLRIAQIEDFIKSLEDGLETEIGESATRLSGGQKQRLAIARAILRDPSILILDEATSAMDSESERNFQMTLDSIAKRYTVIVVAHRLSTIKKSDKIFVIEDGRLIQEGNFETLDSKEGIFSDLVSAQFEG